MSSSPQMQSAFVQIDWSEIRTDNSVLSIRELAPQAHINLRGSSEDGAFIAAAKSVLGLDLPIQANTFVSKESRTVIWLGPNEWLIIDELSQGTDLVSKLREACTGSFSSAHEITGGNAILEIKGDKAIALLAKGCPMDLHEREFKTGDSAQTLLGKAGMTLWKTDDQAIFKVLVRRSFADYVGLWLIDAAREFAE